MPQLHQWACYTRLVIIVAYRVHCWVKLMIDFFSTSLEHRTFKHYACHPLWTKSSVACWLFTPCSKIQVCGVFKNRVFPLPLAFHCLQQTRELALSLTSCSTQHSGKWALNSTVELTPLAEAWVSWEWNSWPHPLCPSHLWWVRELALPCTRCSTLERGHHTLSGQQSRAGLEDVEEGEPTMSARKQENQPCHWLILSMSELQGECWKAPPGDKDWGDCRLISSESG